MDIVDAVEGMPVFHSQLGPGTIIDSSCKKKDGGVTVCFWFIAPTCIIKHESLSKVDLTQDFIDHVVTRTHSLSNPRPFVEELWFAPAGTKRRKIE